MNEYEEQLTVERIALSRYPEATGVKEIQPVIMNDEKTDAWLVILTTAQEFEFYVTLVTAEDIRNDTQ